MLEFLEEDEPFGDVTSALIPKEKVGKARIEAGENFKVFGLDYARLLFEHFDLKVEKGKEDGEWVKKDDILLRVEGSLRTILELERMVLNLISHLSGIATQTAFYVIKAKSINPDVIIASTRKTTPGLRFFEKMAVLCGGGDTHRFSLSDMVMIKDNHIKALGGIEEALKVAKKTVSFAHKIEIEVESVEDALKAAEMGADVVMLDNMSPQDVAKVVNLYKEKGYYGRVILEASGGINFENLEEYVRTGVNVISIGSLTKNVRSCDVSMEFEL